jgi:hypothetical protein
MTKKQAYKIIKEQYSNYGHKLDFVDYLCEYIEHPQINNDWNEYWTSINTGYISIRHSMYKSAYIGVDYEAVSLARLLFLHNFIEDTYK